MVTVEQVKKEFAGQEPGRGGYGSEFRFDKHKLGVEVVLLADWLPRSEEPSILVTGVDDTGDLTYLWDENDNEPRKDSAHTIAENLADS